MKRLLMSIWLIAILSFTYQPMIAREMEKIHKEFKTKPTLEIKTVSGDCYISKGKSDKIIVDLEYSTDPQDAFRPDFLERDNSLKLVERWYGSSSGTVTWNITVPQGMEIKFSTASGDFTVENLKCQIDASTASGDVMLTECEGEFDLSTASGDIEMENCEGDFETSTASGDQDIQSCTGSFECSTASGDIDISDCEGDFDLSTASGDIETDDLTFEEASDFSTASGNLEITVAKSPSVELELSSASGNINFDLNGNKLDGTIQCETIKRSAHISSDIKFDKEEEFQRGENTYLRKTIARNPNPVIYIKTYSGRISIKQ